MLTIALQLFFSVYRNKNILCLKNLLFYVTLVAFENILKIFSIHFSSPGWIKIAERFFPTRKTQTLVRNWNPANDWQITFNEKKFISSSVNEKSALSCARLFLLFAVALSQEACEWSGTLRDRCRRPVDYEWNQSNLVFLSRMKLKALPSSAERAGAERGGLAYHRWTFVFV